MDVFNCPKPEVWQERQNWLYEELEKAETGFSYLVSDHATALFMDMHIAFCSGAWLSVVIISVSVIDAHLRETEAMDNKIGTAKLLSDFYSGEDINWLRQLRNKYVHHNIDKPIFGINDWFDSQTELESKARRAVKMTISALFQSPGT
jgi:hypothetical protein